MRLKNIKSSYCKNDFGIMVTYDKTDRYSFTKVSELMRKEDNYTYKKLEF